jgi:flagellar protein FlaG
MKVESAGIAGTSEFIAPTKLERIEDARKQKDDQDVEAAEKAGIPPEEFLTKIKGLTEDGLYSVRFENDEKMNQLVVKVVDRETDEIIRQIPPEELLGLRASLNDLRGKIVNTKS